MIEWTPPLNWHSPADMLGQYARLERVRPNHAALLWPAMTGHPDIWRWLFQGPFDDQAAYAEHIATQAASEDPAFYAIGGEQGWSGVGSLMRIDRANGVIEIGNLCFAPCLQRSRVATEAIFLMAEEAFNSGFRRLEWKCNALNGPSRSAAQRFGFAYEGTFRQHMIAKGRNRDTAWFSILDSEWPALRQAFTDWLSPDNFDASGQQIVSLSSLTERVAPTLGRPD